MGQREATQGLAHWARSCAIPATPQQPDHLHVQTSNPNHSNLLLQISSPDTQTEEQEQWQHEICTRTRAHLMDGRLSVQLMLNNWQVLFSLLLCGLRPPAPAPLGGQPPPLLRPPRFCAHEQTRSALLHFHRLAQACVHVIILVGMSTHCMQRHAALRSMESWRVQSLWLPSRRCPFASRRDWTPIAWRR